ncbi:MAG: hypothetical protein A4E31_01141 [Methanomassiliicoccales archaeon PtaU1.Bin030]|nr:MAG: hypothetical protein A4E31_01141 [Methanomassiliicoccales archaeon PtaU1.Bin030]
MNGSILNISKPNVPMNRRMLLRRMPVIIMTSEGMNCHRGNSSVMVISGSSTASSMIMVLLLRAKPTFR